MVTIICCMCIFLICLLNFIFWLVDKPKWIFWPLQCHCSKIPEGRVCKSEMPQIWNISKLLFEWQRALYCIFDTMYFGCRNLALNIFHQSIIHPALKSWKALCGVLDLDTLYPSFSYWICLLLLWKQRYDLFFNRTGALHLPLWCGQHI